MRLLYNSRVPLHADHTASTSFPTVHIGAQPFVQGRYKVLVQGQVSADGG